jgi:hypothetical protein
MVESVIFQDSVFRFKSPTHIVGVYALTLNGTTLWWSVPCWTITMTFERPTTKYSQNSHNFSPGRLLASLFKEKTHSIKNNVTWAGWNALNNCLWPLSSPIWRASSSQNCKSEHHAGRLFEMSLLNISKFLLRSWREPCWWQVLIYISARITQVCGVL